MMNQDEAFALLQQQAQQVAHLLHQQQIAEAQRHDLQGQVANLAAAAIAAARGQPQQGRAVKPLALPKFSGSSKPGPNEAAFAPWLSTVLVLTREVVDIGQRTHLLIGALEGPALAKFSILGEPELRAHAPDSEEALRLFFARLFTEEETEVQRDQRFARNLSYKGDMGRYIDDFVREVAAFPTPVPELHRVRYFLTGLNREPLITTMINTHNPQTTADLLRWARQYSGMASGGGGSTRPAYSADTSAPMEVNAVGGAPSEQRRCYNCGKPGHLRRDCRNSKARQGNEGGQGRWRGRHAGGQRKVERGAAYAS